MICIESLSHIYLNGKEVKALQEINLQTEQGQFVALIGPSGCGKSTLIRLIANLITPSQGRITINGFSPEKAVQQKKIAWMAQNPALIPWLSAVENVDMAARFQNRNNASPLDPMDAITRVGLSEFADAYPNTLSGGMQQRLALARLLIQDAQLWLMDEPFAALDELTRERLTGELFELWRDRKPTVLWITHNIYEAVKLADRILVFSQQPGQIIADITNNAPYPREEFSQGFQQTLKQLRAILHQPLEDPYDT